jgi:hypothetical protein
MWKRGKPKAPKASVKRDFWKDQEHQFLFLTLFLALAMGVPAGRSLLEQPESVLVVSSSREPGRAPAAVTSSTVGDRNISMNKAKNITVVLDCKSLDLSSEVDASHLRLISSNCLWSDVVIKNNRNGYTASIVDLGSNKFTTDFIELADGENLLELSGRDSQGKTIAKKFRVKRAPASN